MAKKTEANEASDRVTYWRLKSGVHFQGTGEERQRFGVGDVVEFGAGGPPKSIRDKFDLIDNPRVEIESEE